MGKRDVVRILQKFRLVLEKKIRVERIVLFGSWAKGMAWEASDIDVVVISADFRGKDHWLRSKLLGSAVYNVFAPIQAVAVTPEEWDAKTMTICELAQNGEILAA
ncbi:MAG: nucleotidyltransferase domain-containing protein [Candidatus Omnitrophica bacterium]|nr:nucleotidyltransferase domain-containing protein [Candidatus Omnitrophota bacterium]